MVDAYNGGSSITIEPEKRLVKGATRYNNGGVPDNFANYFMMEFSHPVIEYGTYNGDTLLHHQTDVAADYTCAYLKFDVPAGEKLTIRTASSFISPEQAAINFNREVADADVQLISGKAREQWNNYLGRVEAEGGTDEQLRTFYSCLYRTLLFHVSSMSLIHKEILFITVLMTVTCMMVICILTMVSGIRSVRFIRYSHCYIRKFRNV